MNTYYENYLCETGLNKNVILFIFGEDHKSDNIIRITKNLKVCNNYFISDYDLFDDIVCCREKNKINNDHYLFYLCGDTSDICLKKSIKLLIRKKINFRFHSYQDYVVLYKIYCINYLVDKGIDTTGQIINIDSFTFDNFLFGDCNGFFECGDLVLPSLFGDYSMAIEGPYEYSEVMVKKDDIVFDCGANIGSFSALALSKGSEVHAFEPIHETFLLLNNHLRHYQRSKLYLNNIGLSNRKGLIDFYIRNSGENSYFMFDAYLKKIQCYITTIDEYVKEKNIPRVDFIKADIEGAERDMLIGAFETIKKYKPKISICTYHFNDDPQMIEVIIKDACSEYNIFHKWKKCYAYV